MSRLAQLKKAGGMPVLPEVACTYLLDALLEIGPVSQTGFGPTRITQAEIRKWQENMCTRLAPWECRTLLRLSEVWIEQSRLSEDAACAPPFSEMAARRANVDAMIDRIL